MGSGLEGWRRRGRGAGEGSGREEEGWRREMEERVTERDTVSGGQI